MGTQPVQGDGPASPPLRIPPDSSDVSATPPRRQPGLDSFRSPDRGDGADAGVLVQWRGDVLGT